MLYSNSCVEINALLKLVFTLYVNATLLIFIRSNELIYINKLPYEKFSYLIIQKQ
jgi:hypothetical protein